MAGCKPSRASLNFSLSRFSSRGSHLKRMPKTVESPRESAGSLWSQLLRLRDLFLRLSGLFLIRGLILLAAAALLVSLTWFVWHLVRLAGLVTLLRWVRLILLCHVSSPDHQRALLRARATSADRHLDWQAIGGVAPNHPAATAPKRGEFRRTHKPRSLCGQRCTKT
jgi:hypothetical protein